MLPEAEDLRQRILSRISGAQSEPIGQEGLTLKELRKRKLKVGNQTQKSVEDSSATKRQKLVVANNRTEDLSNVKIKTLSEIRAEKAKRLLEAQKAEENEITSTNSEVSSTSNYDPLSIPVAENKIQTVATVQPTKRLKRSADASAEPSTERKPKLIRHKSPIISEEIASNTSLDENADSLQMLEPVVAPKDSTNDGVVKQDSVETDNLTDSKLDEVLLLEDEELEENVTFKAEEDILKDIDELLNE